MFNEVACNVQAKATRRGFLQERGTEAIALNRLPASRSTPKRSHCGRGGTMCMPSRSELSKCSQRSLAVLGFDRAEQLREELRSADPGLHLQSNAAMRQCLAGGRYEWALTARRLAIGIHVQV